MSSFQVSSEHIASMVGTYFAFASEYERGEEGDRFMMEYAAELAKANADCLRAQYTRDVWTPVVPTLAQIKAWRAKPLTVPQAFEAIACYEYQCERIEEIAPHADRWCRRFMWRAARQVKATGEAVPWGIDGNPTWLANYGKSKEPREAVIEIVEAGKSIGTATIIDPFDDPAGGF